MGHTTKTKDPEKPIILDEEIFNYLYRYGRSILPKKRFVILTFDEVTTKTVNPNIKPLGKDKTAPTHCAVFCLQHINDADFQPLGQVFYYKTPPAGQMAKTIMAYIDDLKRCELTVLATVSPPLPNYSAIFELLNGEPIDSINPKPIIYKTNFNPRVVHVFDPPALLKALRMIFLNNPILYEYGGAMHQADIDEINCVLSRTKTRDDLTNELYNSIEHAVELWNVKMADMLRSKPCTGFCKDKDTNSLPLIAFIANLFDSFCGGLFNPTKSYEFHYKYSQCNPSSANGTLNLWENALRLLRNMYIVTYAHQKNSFPNHVLKGIWKYGKNLTSKVLEYKNDLAFIRRKQRMLCDLYHLEIISRIVTILEEPEEMLMEWENFTTSSDSAMIDDDLVEELVNQCVTPEVTNNDEEDENDENVGEEVMECIMLELNSVGESVEYPDPEPTQGGIFVRNVDNLIMEYKESGRYDEYSDVPVENVQTRTVSPEINALPLNSEFCIPVADDLINSALALLQLNNQENLSNETKNNESPSGITESVISDSKNKMTRKKKPKNDSKSKNLINGNPTEGNAKVQDGQKKANGKKEGQVTKTAAGNTQKVLTVKNAQDDYKNTQDSYRNGQEAAERNARHGNENYQGAANQTAQEAANKHFEEVDIEILFGNTNAQRVSNKRREMANKKVQEWKDANEAHEAKNKSSKGRKPLAKTAETMNERSYRRSIHEGCENEELKVMLEITTRIDEVTALHNSLISTNLKYPSTFTYWVLTIQGMMTIVNFLESKNYEYVRTKSFNVDPLNELIYDMMAHNNNVKVKGFVQATKSTLIMKSLVRRAFEMSSSITLYESGKP